MAPRCHPRQGPLTGPSCHDHLCEAGSQRGHPERGAALRPAWRDGSCASQPIREPSEQLDTPLPTKSLPTP
uniref:Uncharacterized protein n=2 Tax=Mus TaxID=862507 RepID=Q3UPP4_MOUSE|nr:unnamed protein product [Mus musculus]